MTRYEPQEIKKYSLIWILLGIIILIALAIWFSRKDQPDINTSTSLIELPAEKAVPGFEENMPSHIIEKTDASVIPESKLVAETVETVNREEIEPELLELDNSDEIFRLSVDGASENLVPWLDAKNIIRKLIVAINDLSQNQIIFKHRAFITAPKKMVAERDAKGLHLPQSSYHRYDSFANAMASIDTQKGLELYLMFRPLFEEVYKEFAYSEEYQLEDIFIKAAARVIDAPVIEGRVGLIKHSLIYKFADQQLESLGDVEKLMIRMGPENTGKIQAKLRQLVESLVLLNKQ